MRGLIISLPLANYVYSVPVDLVTLLNTAEPKHPDYKGSVTVKVDPANWKTARDVVALPAHCAPLPIKVERSHRPVKKAVKKTPRDHGIQRNRQCTPLT